MCDLNSEQILQNKGIRVDLNREKSIGANLDEVSGADVHQNLLRIVQLPRHVERRRQGHQHLLPCHKKENSKIKLQRKRITTTKTPLKSPANEAAPTLGADGEIVEGGGGSLEADVGGADVVEAVLE